MNSAQIDRRSVNLTAAAAAHAPLIQNLIQLYTHDFSEFWNGTSKGDLNAEGRFDPYPLDEYWSRPNWSASLIWCDRVLAGFSLVNDVTHSGIAAKRNMGEFFILRKHRSQGVGGVAAQLIFSQHSGSWEVAVTRRNTRALAFWRKTIHSATNAANIQQMDLQNAHWNGAILRFDWNAG